MHAVLSAPSNSRLGNGNARFAPLTPFHSKPTIQLDCTTLPELPLWLPSSADTKLPQPINQQRRASILINDEPQQQKDVVKNNDVARFLRTSSKLRNSLSTALAAEKERSNNDEETASETNNGSFKNSSAHHRLIRQRLDRKFFTEPKACRAKAA